MNSNEFPREWARARVAFTSHEEYQVLRDHSLHTAVLSGRLRFEAEEGGAWPVVGDWVMAMPNESGPWVLQAVLERRTVLYRGLAERGEPDQAMASNVDVALVICAMDMEFRERRVERYLYLAHEFAIRPVVVLNKIDRIADRADFERRTESVAHGVAQYSISALTGEGVDALMGAVSAGETAVLLGSSGVGKSTLLNRLKGNEKQRTHPVREADSKGRHTTTHRELLELECGWTLIDMPGLREVGLAGGDGVGIDATFADILELATACRFPDCRHTAEPGCRVREAAASGVLEAARLGNYQKMLRELAFRERQADKGAEAAQKLKWRKMHLAMRKQPDKRKGGG